MQSNRLGWILLAPSLLILFLFGVVPFLYVAWLSFHQWNPFAANPDIIIARGSGQGPKGPDAEKGGYDGASFWARGGVWSGAARDPEGWPQGQMGPAFGDVMGGMATAGAIAAALQEALSDPTRLETMGRAARRCLETRFRRDVMADSLEALYASVAAGGSVPRGRTGLAGEP